jgi:mono/diheme cytochrome c family protein
MVSGSLISTRHSSAAPACAGLRPTFVVHAGNPFAIAFPVILLGLLALTGHARLSDEQLQQLPPPATQEVDFASQVKPILEASCVKCHARGKAKGGFSLETRPSFLRGGDSGSAVVPGRSRESYLVELVSGLDPDNVMPKKGSRLKPAQVSLLRAWIDQGARWDEAISFERKPTLNLAPRKPELPVGTSRTQDPVDRLMSPYLREHGIPRPAVVLDRLFARRAYLDVVGLLPAPEELDAFVQDPHPDKRDRLVEALLADRRRYAAHWLTFWNDLLRNDYRGTGYIDDGRKQITGWLMNALLDNLPFDEFVRQLVNPNPDTEGFANGIVWRGVVNASQTPQMQAAQNIAQVFMGVNLKCASCHDSFINDWMLADAYGLASVYADGPLEMVRCDRPTGDFAAMKFLYPELGTIDPQAPKPERLRQLADLMTSERNGRLARTIVNRLWARLFGRGLVEPVDDLEAPAWNQDLLDWLAADLVDHRYDLKHTLRLLLTSEVYQWPAVPVPEQAAGAFVFRGPTLRRLSAEQYLDALASITGEWPVLPASEVQLTGVPPAAIDPKAAARPLWIWNVADATNKTAAGAVFFRRSLHLDSTPREAAVVITCDNSFRLYLNGREVISGSDLKKPKVLDIRASLAAGENVLAVEAVNDPGSPAGGTNDPANPAGLIVYVRLRSDTANTPETTNRVLDLVSDRNWMCSTNAPEGWKQAGFDETGWQPANELGEADTRPWHLGAKLTGAVAATAYYGHAPAALMNNDALFTALGRPNREQVATTRSSLATTLQALELTNGQTQADLLQRAAARLTAAASGSGLVATLYRRALGREPTPDEQQLAASVLGSPVTDERVADFVWTLAMLPEFQFIH